jgi:hypothetical protein
MDAVAQRRFIAKAIKNADKSFFNEDCVKQAKA